MRKFVQTIQCTGILGRGFAHCRTVCGIFWHRKKPVGFAFKWVSIFVEGVCYNPPKKWWRLTGWGLPNSFPKRNILDSKVREMDMLVSWTDFCAACFVPPESFFLGGWKNTSWKAFHRIHGPPRRHAEGSRGDWIGWFIGVAVFLRETIGSDSGKDWLNKNADGFWLMISDGQKKKHG